MRQAAAASLGAAGFGVAIEQPVLSSKRLILRPFEMRDAEALHVFFADTEATRFWDNPHTSFAETEAFVEGTRNALPSKTCDFILELDGRVIGKAGMWSKPDVGFFVLPAFQRQGFAREALEMILPHLFATYDIPALTADVDPDNLASLALLTGLGFRETGRAHRTIEIGGRWCDSIYLALNRAD